MSTRKDEAFGVIPVYKSKAGVKLLLVHRVIGHWEFPKGHGEGDETSAETARREFEEETGIKDYQFFENIFFTQHYSFTLNNQTVDKTVTYFLVEVKDRKLTLQKNEIQSARWVSPEELVDQITFDSGKRLGKEIQKYLISLE